MFFLVATVIWFAINYYIGLRFSRNDKWRRLVWTIFIVNALLLPITFYLHGTGAAHSGLIFWVTYVGAGFGLTLFPLLLVAHIFISLVNASTKKSDDPGRREFLTKSVNVTLAVASLGLTTVGVAQARNGPRPVIVDVPIKNLPDPLDGYSIVQITDTHIGPTIRNGYAQSIVDISNRFQPDMVAVTGDFADGWIDELAPHVAPFSGLYAPDGVYFVTGNHEYYWNLLGWLETVEKLGMKTLINEHVVIEKNGAKILLAGVTDHTAARHYPPHAPNPKKAVENGGDRDVTIFLAHQPKSADSIAAAGADLVLSGHTHGGQFFPWTYIVPHVHPVPPGLSDYKNMKVYVSVGAAYWGPPLRTFNKPEVTKLVLRKA